VSLKSSPRLTRYLDGDTLELRHTGSVPSEPCV
jgi:hypothetical protein